MLLDELKKDWSDLGRLKTEAHTLIAINDGLEAELQTMKLGATAQSVERQVALVGMSAGQQAR
jgi:hypothetical protein